MHSPLPPPPLLSTLSSPDNPEHLSNASHRVTVSSYMEHLLHTSALTDVVLHIAPDYKLHAHVVVLSHYSKFFSDIFRADESNENRFDVWLEGFDECVIRQVLEFMYTGRISGQIDKNALLDAAIALHIHTLVGVVNQEEDVDDEDEDEEEDDYDDEQNLSNNNNNGKELQQRPCGGGNNSGGGGGGGGGKRRKQARPKRHTEEEDQDDDPPSPDMEVLSPSLSLEDDPEEEEVPKPAPPLQPLCPSPVAPLPPVPPHPHYLFLRSMVQQQQQQQLHAPTHHHPHHVAVPAPSTPFYPQELVSKRINNKGSLWGKVMMGKHAHGVGSAPFHHGSSRAQHSAPRGGPPRAWSNQDLTEALHNVWNKKMTTSQASRIFGIPYNSLLMYVRGKYGKSLKLDLLKKGLDLALLEKQRKATTSGGGLSSSASSSPSSSSPKQQTTTISAGHNNNRSIEWMNNAANNSIITNRMNSSGGQFHHHVLFGNNTGK